MTLPYSAYSDAAVLAAERERVFKDSWQYVGHTGDLASLTTLPTSVNQIPLVLTRDGGGDIRALVNVCSHRGSIVCLEPESKDSLTCPYHAWRYRLDGTLARAPRSEREDNFEPTEHGLEELPLGRWGPFLFVATSHEAIPFAEAVGDLPALVKTAGVDVDSLVFHHRTEYDLAANWKVCAENFLECYHCRLAHPGFSKEIDTSPDGYLLEVAPTFSTQYGPVRDTSTDSIFLGGPIPRAQFHLLYPNTAVNIMAGEPNLSIGPIKPNRPDHTTRLLDYFFGPDVDASWIDPMLEFDNQVGLEDKVLVENMQTGLTARPEKRGRLFVDSEKLISHFEEYLGRHLEL